MSKDCCGKCQATTGDKTFRQEEGETFEQFFERVLAEDAPKEPAAPKDERLEHAVKRDQETIDELARQVNESKGHAHFVRGELDDLSSALHAIMQCDELEEAQNIASNAILTLAFRLFYRSGVLDGVQSLRLENGKLIIDRE